MTTKKAATRKKATTPTMTLEQALQLKALGESLGDRTILNKANKALASLEQESPPTTSSVFNPMGDATKPTRKRAKKGELNSPKQEERVQAKTPDGKRQAQSIPLKKGDFKMRFIDDKNMPSDPVDKLIKRTVTQREKPPEQFEKIQCGSCKRDFKRRVGMMGYLCDNCMRG